MRKRLWAIERAIPKEKKPGVKAVVLGKGRGENS